MKLLSEMTEEEKKYLTPKSIAKERADVSEEELEARIEYLLIRQHKEFTEYFSEKDYDEFYEEAKEAWKDGGMSTKGCSKEIKESMTAALANLGIQDIKTKADFTKILKNSIRKDDFYREVRKVIYGG